MLKEQFVRIPFFGDVKILSNTSVYTIVITIESISQTEINAQDIRVRLSQHENEILSSISETSEEHLGTFESIKIKVSM